MAGRHKYVGLIGFPIKHSISPEFQQAALDFHYIPARYEAWETSPGDLAETIARLRQPEYLGANVTVPHKEAVVPLLDEVDEAAARVGAVNTIVNRDGRLVGNNTDVTGFLMALERDASYRVAGKRALVLGAGGAARAVVFALVQAGAKAIAVATRRIERAVALTETNRTSDVTVTALDDSAAALAEIMPGIDLLVNATPVGMRHTAGEREVPIPARLLRRGILVYDLVYNPPRTPLLLAADSAGAAILNGLPMLVYQGAAAFELWTGKPAPLGLMLERARQQLSRGGSLR